MDKVDKAIQTDKVQIYDPRFSLKDLECLKRITKMGKLLKESSILIDIEDFIMDQFLKKGTINTGMKPFNVYLRSFALVESYFKVKDGQLNYNYKSNIFAIRNHYHSKLQVEQIELFEHHLVTITNNKWKFFNMFNKVVLQKKLTLVQGFATFVFYLTGFLNRSTFSFCFDVILLLYLNINKNRGTTDINEYFILNYLENGHYKEVDNIKEDLKTIKIKPMINIINIEYVIDYLCLFFKGISSEKKEKA